MVIPTVIDESAMLKVGQGFAGQKCRLISIKSTIDPRNNLSIKLPIAPPKIREKEIKFALGSSFCLKIKTEITIIAMIEKTRSILPYF